MTDSLLIFEPDPVLRATLVREAGARGHSVTVLGATDVVTQPAWGEGRIGIVACDLQENDGLAIARLLKHQDPTREVVITYADRGLWSVLEPYERTAFSFFAKPIDLDPFFAMVSRLSEKGRLYSLIRQAKAEWLEALDAITDPIALFDPEGRLVRGNIALARLHGWPVTALKGHTCAEVGFCGGGCPQCAVGRAICGGPGFKTEVTRSDGEIFTITTLPIGQSRERVSVVQVANRVTEEVAAARRLRLLTEELAQANADLTRTLAELRTAQVQLVQSEKLAAIGQLVAGVAHELNNPLTSIVGYAQLAQQDYEEQCTAAPSARRERGTSDDLRRIVEESERAAAIVRNLLSFARPHPTARALCRMHDVIGTALSFCGYELRLREVTVDVAVPRDLPPVLGDATQLQQAFLNLFVNAQQAIASRATRGRLEVQARYDEECQSVVVAVCDDGPGIRPEYVARIFDPFFTTKPVGQGTGLGLSICYGVIRDHGGHIGITSEPHTRTIFTVELPARGESAASPVREVLIGQREGQARQFLSAIFAGWGHKVIAPDTMSEVLRCLAANQHDVAVLDRSVCETGLAEWKVSLAGSHSPIIFTGVHGNDDVDRLVRSHATAVVNPPFQLGAVRAALRAVSLERV